MSWRGLQRTTAGEQVSKRGSLLSNRVGIRTLTQSFGVTSQHGAFVLGSSENDSMDEKEVNFSHAVFYSLAY